MRFKKGHIPWNQGKPHSEETKKKISEAHKGKHLSEEHKNKLSEALKRRIPWNKDLTKATDPRVKSPWNIGRSLSEEHKLKTSKALKGRFTGEKNPFYDRHHSEETKMKMSESHKGHVGYWKGKNFSDETKRKISEAGKGRHPSEETRKKLRESKLRDKNPNWRGGISLEYGENWPVQRLRALQRDEYTCQDQDCDKTRDESRIDVHHIIPFRRFKDYKEANRLDNLKSLCQSGHTRADGEFRRGEFINGRCQVGTEAHVIYHG